MPAAYQDENGKWWKQCSTTKEVFGPVDNKEDLAQWFVKNNEKSDGFAYQCKQVTYKLVEQYRKQNADKIKKYNQENADKIKEIKRQYRKKNPNKIRKYHKKYRQTAAGFFNKYKSSAKQRGINFTLTLEWFEEQMTKPEFNICAISGIQFVDSNGNCNEPFTRSLDRISSTKGYTPDNVRWVCFKYNSWKGNLTLHDIARIFKYTAQSHNVDPVEILKQVS